MSSTTKYSISKEVGIVAIFIFLATFWPSFAFGECDSGDRRWLQQVLGMSEDEINIFCGEEAQQDATSSQQSSPEVVDNCDSGDRQWLRDVLAMPAEEIDFFCRGETRRVSRCVCHDGPVCELHPMTEANPGDSCICELGKRLTCEGQIE